MTDKELEEYLLSKIGAKKEFPVGEDVAVYKVMQKIAFVYIKGSNSNIIRSDIKAAKENNCEASELNCYINNKRAHKFLKKEGYEAIGLYFQKSLQNKF